MADDKPIIVIKKSGGHGGHHGGAWKVAYADFVTAMMAFFMVMWLVNSAEVSTKQNIASYFRKPGLFTSGSGTPLLIGEAGILPDAYVPPHPSDTKKQKGNDQSPQKEKSGTDETELEKRITTPENAKDKGAGEDPQAYQGANLKPESMQEALQMQKAAMERIAKELKETIAASPELKELLGIVDVKVQPDGLNIEIMDTEKSSMFASGSATIQGAAKDAFAKIAGILKKLPNKIDIVGHTDAQAFSSTRGGYSNWELSADRANAARRLVEQQGIPPSQITSVVGRADQELKRPEKPLDPSNRRITLKVRFDFDQPLTAFDGIDGIERPDTPKIEPKKEAEPTPKPAEDLSPKVIISETKERKKPTALPDAGPIKSNPAPTGNDLIFGEAPVLGPPDPFTGFN